MVKRSKKEVNKWNYSIELGTKIIHESLINILKDENEIEINQLLHLLNKKCKKYNFKLYGKRKDIST